MIAEAMEWLARIEHKLDIIISNLFIPTRTYPPMEFDSDPCPLCKQPVKYQLHHSGEYVLRRCGCKTGRVPTTISLAPIGEENGNKPSHSRDGRSQDVQDSEDRQGRKAR